MLAAFIPAAAAARGAVSAAAAVSVAGVTLDKSAIECVVGEEGVKLNAAVLPADATDKRIIWTADNPDIVSSDRDGNLTLLKTGSTRIRAISYDGLKEAECAIVVRENKLAVSALILSRSEIKARLGDADFKLTVDVEPRNAENSGFRWSSSDTRVALVSNGRISFFGEGTCTITVRSLDTDAAAECVVTVSAPKKDAGRILLIILLPAGCLAAACGTAIIIVKTKKKKGMKAE